MWRAHDGDLRSLRVTRPPWIGEMEEDGGYEAATEGRGDMRPPVRPVGKRRSSREGGSNSSGRAESA